MTTQLDRNSLADSGRNYSHFRRIGAPMLGVIILAGCSSSASIDSWQRGLERYADQQSSGDMTFLREPTEPGTRGEFAMLGGLSPDSSTDVSGRLLDRASVDGSNWLVFIVGAVKDRVVQDIRLAAVTDEPGQRRWFVSESNPGSLQGYLIARRVSAAAQGNTANQPQIYGLFPPDSDVFRVEQAGNTISAVDAKSGARWTIVIDNHQAAAANSNSHSDSSNSPGSHGV